MSGHTTHDGVSPTYVAPAIYRRDTMPDSTILGDLWLDMSLIPAVLKQYTATGWEAIGGGSGAVTEIEVDFGSTPVYDATFTITDAAIISSANSVLITESGKPATGRVAGDAQWDSIVCSTNPGVGSAVVYVQALPGPVVGKRKLQYMVI